MESAVAHGTEQGYPVGCLIAWRNPTVKLEDGTSSAGKRILIDGQQRVTALMAALLGREVLTKDYEAGRSIRHHREAPQDHQQPRRRDQERRKLMALKIKTWFEAL